MGGCVNIAAQRTLSGNIIINIRGRTALKAHRLRGGLRRLIGAASYAPAAAFPKT